MQKFYLIFYCSIITWTASSQVLSVDDLLSIATVHSQKIDHFLSKKGFARELTDFSGDSLIYIFQQGNNVRRNKGKHASVYINNYREGNTYSVIYKTSSVKDFTTLCKKLEKQDFRNYDSSAQEDLPRLLRKKNTSVFIEKLAHEDDTLYSFLFSKKELPLREDIYYANDLLLFTSHYELATVFGESNVKRDLYFFADNEIKPCSVLFPHTSRQAVFIWEDDSLYSELSSVIIGGNLRISGDLNYTEPVPQNSWILENGIHSNMNLRELLAINGSDFLFYGKQSGYFLSVVPGHNGKLDLGNIILILDCLNCIGTKLLDAETVSAKDALSEKLGIFIIRIILSPPENADQKMTSR